MNTGKNSVKTIMHINCSLLSVLNVILTVLNFYILISSSIDSLKSMMIEITSVLFLLVSVIFIITGMLISEKEIAFTAKAKRNIFILSLLAALFSGKPQHGLQGLLDLNKKKSIRRQWNAPAILIVGILLFFMDFLTAIVVTEAETLDIGYILSTFISYPWGMVLTVQFIIWILLILSSFVWYYIDTKSRIQIPNNMKNLSQKDDKKTLVQCSSCATVFHYDRYEGICPNCGKYNQLTSNTFYVENTYKSKKAIFAVFKSIGMIILIFVVIIVGTLIKYKLAENNEPDGMNIKIPTFNFEVGEEKDKTEINDHKDNSKNSDNTDNLEEGENNDSSENLENKNTHNFTPDEINMLLDEIKEEDNLEATYHKEIYKNNLTDDSGEKYNEVTILIANNESEKVYWYKFYKYLKTSEKYKEGEIVFYMGAESSTLTKSDIINE